MMNQMDQYAESMGQKSGMNYGNQGSAISTQQLPSVNEMLAEFRQSVGLDQASKEGISDPFAQQMSEPSPEEMTEQGSLWGPTGVNMPSNQQREQRDEMTQEDSGYKEMNEKVEKLAASIVDEIEDPDSPITVEEAEQLFTERYTAMMEGDQSQSDYQEEDE